MLPYTRDTPPQGFYARVVRNPAMRLVFFEPELLQLDLLKRLDQIKCPALIIAGEEIRSRRSPIWRILRRQSPITPDLVRLERFGGAGHSVYRDRPEAFFSLLRDFIRV